MPRSTMENAGGGYGIEIWHDKILLRHLTPASRSILATMGDVECNKIDRGDDGQQQNNAQSMVGRSHKTTKPNNA